MHNRARPQTSGEARRFDQTCSQDIPFHEENFRCLISRCIHLTSNCTNLSEKALSGIRELGENALVLRNACGGLKKRDKLIETASWIQQPSIHPSDGKRPKLYKTR